MTKADLPLGFGASTRKHVLSYDYLVANYQKQPGLTVDKLKATLELVW